MPIKYIKLKKIIIANNVFRLSKYIFKFFEQF